MKFGEDHKVIISSMTKDEAKVFVDFLEGEGTRHQGNIQDAEEYYKHCENHGLAYYKTMMEFVKSQIWRHQEDIEEAKVLIQTVKHWFELEDKPPLLSENKRINKELFYPNRL